MTEFVSKYPPGADKDHDHAFGVLPPDDTKQWMEALLSAAWHLCGSDSEAERRIAPIVKCALPLTKERLDERARQLSLDPKTLWP